MRILVALLFAYSGIASCEEIVAELSKESGLPSQQVEAILKLCGNGAQMVENICSFRDEIVSRNRLNALIEQKAKIVSETCSVKIKADHEAWKAAADKKCYDRAFFEDHGTMAPQQYNECMTKAATSRYNSLVEADLCGK